MSEIGTLIYNRRKELDLTLEEVGNAVGVSKSTVKKWENGYISNMRRDKIESLARVLQISPVRLLNVKEHRVIQLDDDKPHFEEEECDVIECAPGIFIGTRLPSSDKSSGKRGRIAGAVLEDKAFERVVAAYGKLNSLGKEQAADRIEELAEIEKYKK